MRCFLTVVVFVIAIHDFVHCDDPPIFTNTLDLTSIPENVHIGYYVGTLQARDDNPAGLKYSILRSDFFKLQHEQAPRMLVIKNIDRESTPQLAVMIAVTDSAGQRTTKRITILIADENDEKPKFDRSDYSIAIPEDTKNGTVVLTPIVVTDVDIKNSLIEVKCDIPNIGQQFKGVCDMFKLVRTKNYDSRKWTGELRLNGKLDFIVRALWQLPMIATDGNNTQGSSIEVQVKDVQDRPPKFISALNLVLIEGMKRGEFVMKLVAEDQDIGIPRPVRYTITHNPGNLFQADSITGIMTIAVTELDRDRDPTLVNGFVRINVTAREVISESPLVLGNDSQSTSEVNIIITVLGINDNKPVWTASNGGVAEIREDIGVGAVIPQLTLQVENYDQERNGSFVLSCLTYADIFELVPGRGSQVASVNIRIKNNTKIDYESAQKEFIVKLLAEEDESLEKYTGEMNITVKILDVNDNSPQLDNDKAIYIATINELSTGGTAVSFSFNATDRDSGMFGKAGIRYSIVGNGAEKLLMDPLTGRLTVAPCATPGSGACLDAETQALYDVTFIATDNGGSGHAATKTLQVQVLDDNDNKPVFPNASPTYSIQENLVSAEPIIQVRATDRDSSRNGNNKIVYKIVGDNPGNLWTVNPDSATITATRPVDFEAIPEHKGFYTVMVQAKDSSIPFHSATAKVTINVIDINDKTPQFVPADRLTKQIFENVTGYVQLFNLTAKDGDLPSGNNGKLYYSIEAGAEDKFVIDLKNGTISTTNTAKFDYNVKSEYNLNVIVRDGGIPFKQGQIFVDIKIIDTNNKAPVFVQNPLRKTVYENATVGGEIYKVTALDSDVNSTLHYTVIDKDERNALGMLINYNVTLFHVNATSGAVTVATKLNRDLISEVRMVILANDTQAPNLQTATAVLFITILDVNDKSPTFSPPWTITKKQLFLVVKEDHLVGTMVASYPATDPDGPISEYKLIDRGEAYFIVTGQADAGTITLRRSLDYEKEKTTNFTLEAYDSGIPRLKAVAYVNVTIINTNDEDPIFSQAQYSFNFTETSSKIGPSYTRRLVGFVQASDADEGDYGVIAYNLTDSSGRFEILPRNDGVNILLRAAVILDREKTPSVILQISAFDSQNDISVQRKRSVPVFIRVLDLNDNSPSFISPNYYTSVADNSPNLTEIIQVSAFDVDLNQTLTYSIVTAPLSNLFAINPNSGVIRLVGSLRGRDGELRLTVRCTDNAPELHSVTSIVTLNVLAMSRTPPVWVVPNITNAVINVAEEQYFGMVITVMTVQAKLAIEVPGIRAKLTYGFIYNNQFVNRTPEFLINPITGVLSVSVRLDREKVDRYSLLLAVKDSGDPPLESRRYLLVNVTDVDDHKPTFPVDATGAPTPYQATVPENGAAGVLILVLGAVDKDVGNPVYYYIVGGNIGGAFRLNEVTGQLFTNRTLDRESVHEYRLQVQATNLRRLSLPPARRRRRRAVDPSVTTVVIRIGDLPDNVPEFAAPLYRICVSVRTSFDDDLLTVKATDKDSGRDGQIVYGLDPFVTIVGEANSQLAQLFNISADLGELILHKLMTPYNHKTLRTNIRAWNPTNASKYASVPLEVLVVPPENEAIITLSRPPNYVDEQSKYYLDRLAQATNAQSTCSLATNFHETKAHELDPQATDWTVAAVKKNGQWFTSDELSDAINGNHTNLPFFSKVVSSKSDESDKKDHRHILILVIIACIVFFGTLLLFTLVFLYLNYRKNEEYKRMTRTVQESEYDNYIYKTQKF